MNENNNLRIGASGAGLFVGSTEILGGGLVIQYEDDYDYSEPTYFILNKSNTPVHFVTSSGEEITINPNSIYHTVVNTNDFFVLRDNIVCSYKFIVSNSSYEFHEQYAAQVEEYSGTQLPPNSNEFAQGMGIISITQVF